MCGDTLFTTIPPITLELKYPADEAAQKRWLMRKLDGWRTARSKTLRRHFANWRTRIRTLSWIRPSVEAEYFDSNRDRMRYPEFRKKNLFVRSGVIEAGCKTVIGSRLKQSVMFWTVRGANAIIPLRCCCISARFQDYWEERAS
jgi:hypothetical protein